MEHWEDVREWRRFARSQLRSKRSALPRGEKENVRSRVCDLLRINFPELCDACIGFYWPFQGEIDLRHCVESFLALGSQAALPVVSEKGQPLEFWSWKPGVKMGRGIWNIPIPADRKLACSAGSRLKLQRNVNAIPCICQSSMLFARKNLVVSEYG